MASSRRKVPAPEVREDQLLGIGLPANIPAERALLGAVLLDNAAYDLVADRINTIDFSHEGHQRIWSSIVTLRATQPASPVDFTTIVEVLNRAGELQVIGGIEYLGSLTDGLPRAVNIEHYAGIVREKAQRRALVTRLSAIATEAIDPAGATTSDLINRAGEHIDLIGRENSGGALLSTSGIWTREWNDLCQFVTPRETRRGISTGFAGIDALTSGGLHRGQLVVVGARPSVGKTAAMLEMARAVGRYRFVALFNQEMSAAELYQRMVCQEACVSLSKLRAGLLNQTELRRVADAVPVINGMGIYLDESSSIGISEIRARCRRLKREHGAIGMIGIDYLQLLTPPEAENRNNEIAKMSRGAKALAREIDAPVVLLSQLNREAPKRANPRPTLGDLRDSGAIEQDADLVLLIHRMEQHLRLLGQEVPVADQGTADFILAKNRNGACGDLKVAFLAQYASFRDIGGVDAS